jgi:hypothetical protein
LPILISMVVASRIAVLLFVGASESPAVLPPRTPHVTPPPPARASSSEAGGCLLSQSGSQTSASAACIGCHGKSDRGINHPVDVDYETSQRKPAAQLRPVAEVVRRGLLIPEGKIQCVTCHDGNSPWKYHLVVPPGAPIAPATNVADRRTYEPSGAPGTPAVLAPGADVARKPLCTSCHSLD